MLYHYSAVDSTGKVYEGEFDSVDVAGVLRHLAAQQLRPISIKPLKESLGKRSLFGGRIKIADKIFLTKYISLMLRVGTDLLSAINILIVDFEKPAMKSFLLEVRDTLVKGQPFHTTFAKYPHVFSPVFINLVKSAEASGTLQKTFEELSESLASEAQLKGQVRAALVYPIILLVAAIAISLFISTFALPRIAQVFSQGTVQPPFFSRIVFGIGLWIDAHFWWVLSTIIFGGAFSVYFFFFVPVGRRVAGSVFSRVPVIRKVRRDLAVQRFASTLSSLLRAGLPIMDAVNITADTVGSEEFRASLNRIANEGLAKGLTVGEAFKRETVFPRVVTNLIAISEKAGHTEEVLDTLAKFYTSNINSSIKSLVAFIEPVLLSLMGLLVATVALSIIVPIYQLTTTF